MALRDYEHWNEDARAVWWQEEGRFGDDGVPPPCKYCGMIPDEDHFTECFGPEEGE